MTGLQLQGDGGRLHGTEWQGIRYVSIELDPAAAVPATLTIHLNHPTGALVATDVTVDGGRRLGPPPHVVEINVDTVVLRFEHVGDHSPYVVRLTSGGGRPLHPFFSERAFRFTIDCDLGSDCREAGRPATAQPTLAPAVDLLTKDFNGFVRLITDWVSARHPHVTDLSTASFEQMILQLVAWFGDMTSYYQDRVANEAFIETASQRFSLRQHAVLLGTHLDDGIAPTTVLTFEPTSPGVIPERLRVRLPHADNELPVVFTVAARTAVSPNRHVDVLRIAAFPDAHDAIVPEGATSVLLFGHGFALRSGDRIAFVQGTVSQIVTLAQDSREFETAGWVPDPSTAFDPLADPPAPVTAITWTEPLRQSFLPWSAVPLRLHANLVDASFGTPRIAVAGPGTSPRGQQLLLSFNRASCVLTEHAGRVLLRSVRLPERQVVHDRDEFGVGRPALDLLVALEPWTLVEHLHASKSFDRHYTAAADEQGAVWLQFGDGTHGREIEMSDESTPSVDIEITYRVGDPATGNVSIGTLTEIVPPTPGTDEEADLAGLGSVDVINVVANAGGRRAHSMRRVKEDLLSSLRQGPLERAVALQDYAEAAMQVPGVGRTTARLRGGIFNTVAVLVDPEAGIELTNELQDRVSRHLERLRMAGREHVVLAAEHVPLDVELVLCADQGVAAHVVRARVLAELRPGSADRPGWFHPDRLTFGTVVRLGDLLAFVQSIPGVRSVTASVFRVLGAAGDQAVTDVIALGGTKVARLDADVDLPENGRLLVLVSGADSDARPLVVDGASS